VCGKCGCSWQPDIAQAEYTNLFYFHMISLMERFSLARQLYSPE
jgi:hypothetical protein